MINPAVYHLTLDICKIGSQKVLSMMRGDTKRTIVIHLTENDRPYSLTAGCTAIFTALKPDGNFIYNACEVDFKNNTIIYRVTPQTTAVNGLVACQLRLIGDNGGLLSAPSFSLVIADLLYNEEPIVDSSSEFNALSAYIASLESRVADGEFNGKSIYIRGSVKSVEELNEKVEKASAGDGYLLFEDLYVFDGEAFVCVGAVRGPRGLSGVYVGSGDMPEGYNVQIDPEGETITEDEIKGIWNSKMDKSDSMVIYRSLKAIGLATGAETIEEIAKALPDRTVLLYPVSPSNASIYPQTTPYAVMQVVRLEDTRISFDYMDKVTGNRWVGSYSESNGSNKWTGWKRLATADREEILTDYSDADGAKLFAALDARLAKMNDDESVHIGFICDPFLGQQNFTGTLHKRGTLAAFDGVSVRYGEKLILYKDSLGTWHVNRYGEREEVFRAYNDTDGSKLFAALNNKLSTMGDNDSTLISFLSDPFLGNQDFAGTLHKLGAIAAFDGISIRYGTKLALFKDSLGAWNVKN